jgi:hypothetical protein
VMRLERSSTVYGVKRVRFPYEALYRSEAEVAGEIPNLAPIQFDSGLTCCMGRSSSGRTRGWQSRNESSILSRSTAGN